MHGAANWAQLACARGAGPGKQDRWRARPARPHASLFNAPLGPCTLPPSARRPRAVGAMRCLTRPCTKTRMRRSRAAPARGARCAAHRS